MYTIKYDSIFASSITIEPAATDKRRKNMATFRKVKFTMNRGNGYGQYIIEARYRGKDIKAYTTDSEAWDWLNDDSNKEKHQDALRHCYYKIVQAYADL